MKKLAIVICNFNKQEYVLKCINSVLKSTYTDFDIFVVDNASSDNSVGLIRSEYDDEVTLIVNEENKGGSGGFNTGIREALKKKYKYIMLLDNDVIIERNAIKRLFEYLEGNEEVAVAGSKIYSMDNPNEIQEMGAEIDFEDYSIRPFYKGYIDDENVPKVVECDYVPACSMMVRVSAIENVGVMAEENFIYWDDIDWGYRFILNGYKVVALSESIVWHKMGVQQKINTFGTYYFWRNKVRFFMKYCNSEQKEKFAELLFEDLFQGIYMCNYIGKYSSAITMLNAVLDGINLVDGKVEDKKILKLEVVEDKLKSVILDNDNIVIIFNGNLKCLRDITNRILSIKPSMKIKILSEEKNIYKQFSNKNIEVIRKNDLLTEDSIVLLMCDNILDLKDKFDERYVYIDKYFNIVKDNEDIKYIKNYYEQKKLLKNTFYPIILQGILKGYDIKNGE